MGISRLRNQITLLFNACTAVARGDEHSLKHVGVQITRKTKLWWDPKRPDEPIPPARLVSSQMTPTTISPKQDGRISAPAMLRRYCTSASSYSPLSLIETSPERTKNSRP